MAHIIAISTITDERFWNALKQAHQRLPKGARWTLAVGSTDGTRAVNVLVHDSVDAVSGLLEEYAGAYATTGYYEADAVNAVGLPR